LVGEELLRFGDARIAFSSRLRRSTTSFGVPAGAKIAFHDVES
jgi:hypothetical protein